MRCILLRLLQLLLISDCTQPELLWRRIMHHVRVYIRIR